MLQLQALVQAAGEDHAEHLWGGAGRSGPGRPPPPPPGALPPPAPTGPGRTCTQAMPRPTAPMILRCSWMKVSSLVMQPPCGGTGEGRLQAGRRVPHTPHLPAPGPGLAHLPPPCRCWRRAPAGRSGAPPSCSSCREPGGPRPAPSGSTHCPASPGSCCCRSSGTAGRTQRLRARPARPPTLQVPRGFRQTLLP